GPSECFAAPECYGRGPRARSTRMRSNTRMEEAGHLRFHDLAEGVAGELGDEREAGRDLGRGELGLAPGPQLVGVEVARRDDGGGDPLTPLLVGEADHGDVGDVRVGPVDLLDLQR